MGKRQVGWRLPEQLLDRLAEYGQQQRRSVNVAVEVLLDRALTEAAERGEYSPGKVRS